MVAADHSRVCRHRNLNGTNKMNSKSLFGVFLLGSMIVAGGCARTGGEAAETQQLTLSVDPPKPIENEGQSEQGTPEKDWGIKVESARLSAGGYMVDFRFRVLNAGKAAKLFDRRIKPHMIDQATGARFIVPSPPKVGQLRSGGNIKENRIYFIFFANPAKYVKSGNKITVVVGDFKAENIVVY
jgi:heme-binding NEAT domain protein